MTQDTFTNTAGTALTTHGSWTTQSGTWVIASGGTSCGMQAGSTEIEACVRWTGNPGVGPAQRSKVTLVNNASTNWMGPGVRHVAGEHTRYGCYVNPFNGLAEINKVVNGTFTTLASTSGISFNSDDEIELEIDGDFILTAYRNGDPISGLIGIEDEEGSIPEGEQGMIGYATTTAALIDSFDDLAAAAIEVSGAALSSLSSVASASSVAVSAAGDGVSVSTAQAESVDTVAGTANGVWLTPSGFRYGPSQLMLSVNFEARPHVDEGTLVGVTFHVDDGSGVVDVPTVLSDRRPNFYDVVSPMPGSGGTLTKRWCCGFDLNLAELNPGTVTVSATIRTTLDGINYDTEVSSITIYNDTDGSDRRPCPAERYIAPAGSGGSDSNDGLTLLTPMLNMGAAINSLISAEGADLHGGIIHVLPGEHEFGGDVGGVSNWHTSGAGHLSVIFESGATMRRTLDINGETLYPESNFLCTGNGASTTCRVLWVNSVFVGDGVVGYIASGVNAEFLFVGGSGSSSWSTGTNLEARFVDDGGPPVSWDGPGTNNGRYACVAYTRLGVSDGFVGASFLMDCLVQNWLAICFYDTGPGMDGVGDTTWFGNAMWQVNCHSKSQDYIHEDEQSAVSGLIDYTGGSNLVISTQVGGAHAGKMRIEAAGAVPFDIFAEAATLVGSRRVGMIVEGFPTGGNNGSFAVLEAGAGYMILDATPTPEAGDSNSKLLTSLTSGGSPISSGSSWWAAVHPDIWRTQGDKQDGGVIGFAVDTDVLGAQGLFVHESMSVTRFVFDDITIPELCRSNFDGCDAVDCTFANLTLAGDTGFTGANLSGSVVRDNVFGTQGGLGSAGAAVIDHCHVISGGAVGTNGTTGSWFDSYELNGYFPTDAVRGNGSGAVAQSPMSLWPGDVAWSQGAGFYGAGSLLWTEDLGEEITCSGAAISSSVAAGASTAAISVSGATRSCCATNSAFTTLDIGADGAALSTPATTSQSDTVGVIAAFSGAALSQGRMSAALDDELTINECSGDALSSSTTAVLADVPITAAGAAVSSSRSFTGGVVSGYFDPIPTTNVQVFVHYRNKTYRVVSGLVYSGASLNGVFAKLAQAIVRVFQRETTRFSRVRSTYNSASDRSSTTVEAEISILASPPIPYSAREVNGTAILATDMRMLVPARNFDPTSGDALYDLQLRL